MNALSNRERVTAEIALDGYGAVVETLISFIEANQSADLPDKIANQLFKPVLEEHLIEKLRQQGKFTSLPLTIFDPSKLATLLGALDVHANL